MPKTVAAAAAQGHLVQPHTWEHRGCRRQRTAGGPAPTSTARSGGRPASSSASPAWPRAGSGRRSRRDHVRSASRAAGMQVVLWSVDSQDWQQPGRLTAAATARIVKNATDLRYADPRHPIVLMHGGKASHRVRGEGQLLPRQHRRGPAEGHRLVPGSRLPLRRGGRDLRTPSALTGRPTQEEAHPARNSCRVGLFVDLWVSRRTRRRRRGPGRARPDAPRGPHGPS